MRGEVAGLAHGGSVAVWAEPEDSCLALSTPAQSSERQATSIGDPPFGTEGKAVPPRARVQVELAHLASSSVCVG
jgi:hypothetical protein